MNIVIFGGSGFLGTSIVEELCKSKNHQIRIFCRNPPNIISNNNVEVVLGNYLNPSDILKALQGMDVLIHLISSTIPSTSSTSLFLELEGNLIPTTHLLEIIPKTTVKKIIFSSSGGTVYGDLKHEFANEKSPTNPISYYGIIKLTQEKLLLKLKNEHDMDISILRISNPYGVYQNIKRGQGALSTFILKGLAGEPIEIWGDGEIVRDYIHISDVTNAFVNALNYTGSYPIFNIGTNCGHSLNALIFKTENILNTKLNIIYKPHRNFDLRYNVLNTDLAQSELNWHPKINVDIGIKLFSNELKKIITK